MDRLSSIICAPLEGYKGLRALTGSSLAPYLTTTRSMEAATDAINQSLRASHRVAADITPGPFCNKLIHQIDLTSINSLDTLYHSYISAAVGKQLAEDATAYWIETGVDATCVTAAVFALPIVGSATCLAAGAGSVCTVATATVAPTAIATGGMVYAGREVQQYLSDRDEKQKTITIATIEKHIPIITGVLTEHADLLRLFDHDQLLTANQETLNRLLEYVVCFKVATSTSQSFNTPAIEEIGNALLIQNLESLDGESISSPVSPWEPGVGEMPTSLSNYMTYHAMSSFIQSILKQNSSYSLAMIDSLLRNPRTLTDLVTTVNDHIIHYFTTNVRTIGSACNINFPSATVQELPRIDAAVSTKLNQLYTQLQGLLSNPDLDLARGHPSGGSLTDLYQEIHAISPFITLGDGIASLTDIEQLLRNYHERSVASKVAYLRATTEALEHAHQQLTQRIAIHKKNAFPSRESKLANIDTTKALAAQINRNIFTIIKKPELNSHKGFATIDAALPFEARYLELLGYVNANLAIIPIVTSSTYGEIIGDAVTAVVGYVGDFFSRKGSAVPPPTSFSSSVPAPTARELAASLPGLLGLLGSFFKKNQIPPTSSTIATATTVESITAVPEVSEEFTEVDILETINYFKTNLSRLRLDDSRRRQIQRVLDTLSDAYTRITFKSDPSARFQTMREPTPDEILRLDHQITACIRSLMPLIRD
ncbi:MAG: hypothetical protein HY860_05655 [Chlamydiales bacterium]|nr:hypothetical protein [Chlamydiales bacterium]